MWKKHNLPESPPTSACFSNTHVYDFQADEMNTHSGVLGITRAPVGLVTPGG